MSKILIITLIHFAFIHGQSLNYFSISDLQNIKTHINDKSLYKNELAALKYIAENAIEEGYYTITKYSAPDVGDNGINDYYSDSPYWWPLEGDPDAPYIRRDGERNPDRFMDHKWELAKLYKGISALAFYSFFTDDTVYGNKANDYLRKWFIDADTRMNPNLKYSQLIRNRTKIRGVGIIDGRRLALLTEAIILLKINNQITEENYESLKKWYKDYLDWLYNSPYGLDERQRGNNHGTWWAVQIASINNFLNIDDSIKATSRYCRNYLIDNQFAQGGRQPLEEKRTRSLMYSAFNLTAHSLVNSVLYQYDIDNWNYENSNGTSLIQATEYLIPYMKQPSKWEIKQIASFNNSKPIFLGFTGLRLKNNEYLKLYSQLSDHESDDYENPTFDPIQIVLDAVVKDRLSNYNK